MSVTTAQGFLASGVHAGIRRSGLDLAIVRSTVPAVGAAVWTTNRVLAAPVVVSKRHLEIAEPQAVVINAGVANAATGSTGIADAEQTAAQTASELGLAAEEVIVLSTGVIGVPLPMERVLAGVREAVGVARPGRRCCRSRGDPHHRPLAQAGRRRRRRIRRGRDGEGCRDDPSTARDDARDRHDRLPARAR